MYTVSQPIEDRALSIWIASSHGIMTIRRHT